MRLLHWLSSRFRRLETATRSPNDISDARISAIDASISSVRFLQLSNAIERFAIGAIWRTSAMPYERTDHQVLDGLIFTIPKNWALKRGLMKVGPAGFFNDDEFINRVNGCWCRVEFLFHLRDLPGNMVTTKGKKELVRVRRILAK